jgi:membrane protease YdiL (CAAX protease family)
MSVNTPPPIDPELMERVGRRLRIGLGLALVAIPVLILGTDLRWTEVLAIPLFAIVFPTLSLAQAPLVRGLIIDREEAYVSSGIAILIMGGVAMGIIALGPGLLASGLAPLPWTTFALWTLGLLTGALLLSLVFAPIERRLWRPSHRNTLDDGLMDTLMPRTPEERRLFAGLSLAAGWGEEMAYRGYLPAAFLLLGIPAWGAMAVAAGIFGLLHAYQGASGVVRTALVGLLLGSSVMVTGSLFPAMAAHALLDLVLGLILGPRILRGQGTGEPNP